MKRPNKAKRKRVAQKHIDSLFSSASSVSKTNKTLADRYMQIARSIRDRIKVAFSKKQKAQMCKKCGIYLVPGRNCTVRTKNHKTLYHCNECGDTRTFGMIREKKEKKQEKANRKTN